MKHMIKNDQDYLAERFCLLDEQTVDQSKIALLKIRSLKFAQQTPEAGVDYEISVKEMVKRSLLHFIPNSFVLSEEGYYFSYNEN
jgi:hypothetical protein